MRRRLRAHLRIMQAEFAHQCAISAHLKVTFGSFAYAGDLLRQLAAELDQFASSLFVRTARDRGKAGLDTCQPGELFPDLCPQIGHPPAICFSSRSSTR